MVKLLVFLKRDHSTKQLWKRPPAAVDSGQIQFAIGRAPPLDHRIRARLRPRRGVDAKKSKIVRHREFFEAGEFSDIDLTAAGRNWALLILGEKCRLPH